MAKRSVPPAFGLRPLGTFTARQQARILRNGLACSPRIHEEARAAFLMLCDVLLDTLDSQGVL